MSESGFHLVLTRPQCLQWHAQMLTYVYSFVFQPQVPRDQAHMETMATLSDRFFALCRQEGPTVCVTLEVEEVQALKHMLSTLERLYAREPRASYAGMALEHLALCRVQLQQAAHTQDAP